MWKYTNSSKEVVVRINPDNTMESCIVTRDDVQKWIKQGNTPLPEDNNQPRKATK